MANSQGVNNRDTMTTWTSAYEIDCKEITPDADEVYKQTVTEPSFMMNIHPPSKDDISKEIWEKGCWECDHIKAVIKALSQYRDSYFLDIGGNIGMWSLTAAAAGHQSFTIEALPENYKRFCGSVNKNSFHDRTHLINIAATDKPATFRLALSRGNMGGTRVVPIDDSAVNSSDKNIVWGVTVDSLNLPTNQPVVLKIDVEGHELMVLMGATEFLQNANIMYAMMELRPNLQNDSHWKEIFNILASKGLKPYRINYEDETPLDINRLDQWKHFKHPKVRYYDVVWRHDDYKA